MKKPVLSRPPRREWNPLPPRREWTPLPILFTTIVLDVAVLYLMRAILRWL